MIWIVSEYEKEGQESLVREWQLERASTAELQDVFGGELALGYQVGEPQRAFAEERIGDRLNLDEFSCFIQAFADEGSSEAIIIEGEIHFLPPQILLGFPDARRIAPA